MSTVTAPAPPARVRLARIATAGRERRRYVLDAAVLLVVVVALVFVLPARAVVAGLGAAGRPHFVVAVALLVWWLVSLLHPRLRASGSHNDTVQVLGGGNVTLSHDTLKAFTNGDPMNACLQVGEINGSGLKTVTMTNSYCDGGNYSVNANGSNGGATLVITGNRFGTGYRYGIDANLGSPFRTTWTDNVDDATGQPVG